MSRLVLLDAVVIIDLHALNLFDKVSSAYSVKITREVLYEARFYRQGDRKIPIEISGQVTLIDEVDIAHLERVTLEAKEAKLAIDPGEASSIAYISQGTEKIIFCSSDQAAVTLLSYMNLEDSGMSVERLLGSIGQNPRLLPRQLEDPFKRWLSRGKELRIYFKRL